MATHIRIMVVSALSLLTMITSAEAEGLIRSRPRLGAWCRYDFTMYEDGELQEHGSMTVAFVGDVTAAGARCRWVEIWIEHEDGLTRVLKVLVPDDAFDRGQSGLESASRGWMRTEEGPVERIPRPEPAECASLDELCLVFSSLGDTSELRQTRSISWNDVPHDCGGIRGTVTRQEAWSSVTQWLSGDAPWGVAAIEAETHANGARRVKRLSMSLQASGKCAQSKLPCHH